MFKSDSKHFEKRCFNTKESIAYLGVGRRFFEKNIMPMLADKSIRAGTSILYERKDLDCAWERYKLLIGNERTVSCRGNKKWDVQKQPVSIARQMENTMLMPITKNNGFEKVALRIIKKHRNT